MDTPIPEFLAEAANKRVSDIFIIAGRPLAEKIDGHLFSSGDRLMPAETEALLRTIYTLAENRDISRAAVIRVIAFRLPDPAELSIPEDVMSVSDYTRGMVLIPVLPEAVNLPLWPASLTGLTTPGKATLLPWKILWNIFTAMTAALSASERSAPTPRVT